MAAARRDRRARDRRSRNTSNRTRRPLAPPGRLPIEKEAPMPDLAAAYHDARIAMTTLAREASNKARDTRVPACPDWTVHDLVAHVTSIASSLSSGAFPPDLNPVQFWDDDMAQLRDRFVDGALAERRDLPLEQILAEWDASGPRIERMI